METYDIRKTVRPCTRPGRAGSLIEVPTLQEIYLLDPRRTESAQLRTILRQPVTAAHGQVAVLGTR